MAHLPVGSDSKHCKTQINVCWDLYHVFIINSCCVSFIYQMQDELHTENNQIYLHPLQSYSPVNNISYAKDILNQEPPHGVLGRLENGITGRN